MKIAASVYLVAPLFLFAAGVSAFEIWPHTGQEKCYDDSKKIPCPSSESHLYYGQDAQHKEVNRKRVPLTNRCKEKRMNS